MRKYIVNLTNHLISINRYYAYPINPDFISRVQSDLEAGDVSEFSPPKLGEILCSLEVGDVMANKAELFGSIHFAGDCGDMLREIVALCLAYVIRDRLDPANSPASIPPYKKPVGYIRAKLSSFPTEPLPKNRVFGPPW